MENIRVCKICGLEKPIYDFGKKDKFKYRTECKVCYNQMRRDFNKLSEEDKLKVKEESKLREEKRLFDLNKKREEKNIERETKKRLKYENLVMEYELRMKEKLEKRNLRVKKYLCVECGESEGDNFYSKTKNKCKKCILSNPNISYSNMSDNKKEMFIQRQRKWVSNNIIRVRVESAKHRAIRKGLIFEITDEIIQQKLNEQDGKCYVSKQPLVIEENNWYGLSLDRLDSNLGYTIDNTVLVTKFVNLSKNNLSLDEYLKLLKEVSSELTSFGLIPALF